MLVTHDPEVGASCDRIIRVRDGRIREEPGPVGLPAALRVRVEREPAEAAAGV